MGAIVYAIGCQVVLTLYSREVPMDGESDSTAKLWAGISANKRRPVRLTLEVVEAIADSIIGGQFPAETLLPSEAAMSESFGVSRTVIRESLKVLETMGLVLKRQGKLSWTAPPQHWDLLDPVVIASHIRHDRDSSFLDDLVTVRTALEAEMAAQAAIRASQQELLDIASILESLESDLEDPERYKYKETLIHSAIMQASKNRIGHAIVSAMQEWARASSQYAEGKTPIALVLHSHRGHEAVVRALTARDPDEAAQAMRGHILSSWAWRYNKQTASDSRGPGVESEVKGPWRNKVSG